MSIAASSPNPGDPAYRRTLGDGGLVLRWSTPEDKEGCVLLACLAAGQEEGQESGFGVRYFEPYTDEAFYADCSTNWALCVDTTPTEITATSTESYAESVRAAAASAQERVVALVYFLPAEFAFDGDAARVAVGKAQIVACKAAYRQRNDENIMKALFDMVNARVQSTNCAFMITSGIPGYYRHHGYEYAIDIGCGLVTHTSLLGSAGLTLLSSFSLRPATLNDLPALERLVYAPRATSELFTGSPPAMLQAQLRWLLGNRPAAYGAAAFYPVHPFFVLEKCDTPEAPPRVVAAAGLINTPSVNAPHPVATVHPLLWDGVENASAVAKALALELVRALDAILADGGAPSSLARLGWMLADAHPLRRWLLAEELAVQPSAPSRYESTTWWVAIPSVLDFLTALTAVFNARLAHATHILGANYATTLHIAGGVVLHIADGAVSVAPADSGAHTKPNVSLPHCALVQLLMGYARWDELKRLFPDVAVEPAAVPLVEVLFPKRSVGSTMYL
ncbi:hypothetical protein DFH09DRAFT_255372 [Mycena vulgaris]|nr:hypothetical protein DFH09DRAFT_255372 [Mycena vulgaris]